MWRSVMSRPLCYIERHERGNVLLKLYTRKIGWSNISSILTGFYVLFLQVRTISLFGEVWGIGPATALKLYEKGHRTLEDLKHEDSLTNSQRLGLKYFDDIKTRIPRQEV